MSGDRARLDDLLGLLALERLENNLFRGQSRDIGSARVYGGQVLGQALSAAQQTIEERRAHSLHAYFLRAGDHNAPIVYEVDRARDGRSFATRRVVAIQHGRPIFNLAASFQRDEDGFEHQEPVPQVPGPEDLEPVAAQSADGPVPNKIARLLARQKPFEFRPVEPLGVVHGGAREARQHIWFRAVGPVPDDQPTHRALLCYASDYSLLGTALLPHGDALDPARLQMASLDHAMWFHRDGRVDDWLLYASVSPNASGARGLALGRIFDRAGRLIATVAQEGLIRLWSEPAKP